MLAVAVLRWLERRVRGAFRFAGQGQFWFSGVRLTDSATGDILTNREVIAVDRDSLCKAGYRAVKSGDTEVYAPPTSRRSVHHGAAQSWRGRD